MRKVLILLFSLFICSAVVAQQLKERRVYYLDMSGSMKQEVSYKDDSGNTITEPLFLRVCKLLEQAIQNIKNDNTEVMVIPFAFDNRKDASLSPINGIAHTRSERMQLVSRIEKLTQEWPTSTSTYHKDPIEDFYYKNRILEGGITYMFLLTDGLDEWDRADIRKEPSNRFKNDLKEWGGKYKNKNVYGFYLMLCNQAYNKVVEDIVTAQPNFWNIQSPNVDINIIRPDSSTAFNCSGGEGNNFVLSKFKGNIKGLEFEAKGGDTIQVKSCTTKGDSALVIELNTIFDRDLLDSIFVNTLHFKLKGADEENVLITNSGKNYNILVKEDLNITCTFKHGASINLTTKSYRNWSPNQSVIPINPIEWYETVFDSTMIGVVKFYEPCIFYNKDSTFVAQSKYSFSLNKIAKKRKSHAKFKFVIDERLNENEFKIYLDEKELNVPFTINSKKVMNLSFWISPNVPQGDYKIKLELIEHDIKKFNEYEITQKTVQEWTIKHQKICNPFWIWFWRFLILLSLLIFSIYCAFLIKQFNAPKLPRPRVHLGFGITPLNLPPANIQIYHKNRAPSNDIDLGRLHRKFIKKIVLQQAAEDNVRGKLYKRFFKWIDKKWNGETITLQANFGGRDISHIIISPLKTNRTINISVFFTNRQNDYKLHMKWVDKNTIANIPESEVNINDTNLYAELYNGQQDGVQNISKSNYISRKIITYYNSITKRH